MSEIKPKSFWKKPEGVTGAIVLGGLLAGGEGVWCAWP